MSDSGEDNEIAADDHSRLLSNAQKALGSQASLSLGARREQKPLTSQHDTYSAGKVQISELLEGGKTTTQKNALKRQMIRDLRSEKISVIKPELNTHEKNKIERIAAYSQVRSEVNKWNPIVLKNREAEQLVFDKDPGSMKPQVASGWSKSKAKTPMEKEIQALLKKSQVLQQCGKGLYNPEVETRKPKLTEREKEEMKAMSLEEALAMKSEMQRLKARQGYFEAKAHRQKKIKSKKYHKMLRKKMLKTEKMELAALEKNDPQALAEKIQKFEEDRLKERMSLKHRGGSKFARKQMIFAKYDKKGRDQVSEMMQLSRELTRKVDLPDASDSDQSEQDSSDDGDTSADTSNPWMVQGKKKAVMESSITRDAVGGYRKPPEVKASHDQQIPVDEPRPATEAPMSFIPASALLAQRIKEKKLPMSFIPASALLTQPLQEEIIVPDLTRSVKTKPTERKPSEDVSDENVSDVMDMIEISTDTTDDDSSNPGSVTASGDEVDEIFSKISAESSNAQGFSDSTTTSSDISKILTKGTQEKKGKKASVAKIQESKEKGSQVQGEKPKRKDTDDDSVESPQKKKKKRKLKSEKEPVSSTNAEDTPSTPDAADPKKKKRKLKSATEDVSSGKMESSPLMLDATGLKKKRKRRSKDQMSLEADSANLITSNKGEDTCSRNKNTSEADKPSNCCDSNGAQAEDDYVTKAPKSAPVSKATDTSWRVMNADEVEETDDEVEDIFEQVNISKAIAKSEQAKKQENLPKNNKDSKAKRKKKRKKSKKRDELEQNLEVTSFARTLEEVERLGDVTDVTSINELSRNLSEYERRKAERRRQTGRGSETTGTSDINEIMTSSKPVAGSTQQPESDGEQSVDAAKLTLAEAFADDDVVAEFAEEKRQVAEKDAIVEPDGPGPGWGDWTGSGVIKREKFKDRSTRNKKNKSRRDDNIDHVIINEKAINSVRKHQVKDVPFPFTTLADYEASLRQPIGRDWLPETAHRNSTKPRVVTRAGVIIQPIDKSAAFSRDKTDRNRKAASKL